ncbi:MAG TPA: hypothetical protein DD414_12630 [Lachnospiraceae bacterium]|nr:hypothetical protein [Lachnospiraceae bacterium]
MKKKGFHKIKTILLSGVVWTFASLTVFAGDINGNEQAVLDAAEGTFESDGKQYVATDAAKDRIRNYLSQDGVDLTAEQASKAISQAFGNIEMGIAQGYLVPAPGQEEVPPPEEIPEEELPADQEEDPLKETDPASADAGTEKDAPENSREDDGTDHSPAPGSEGGTTDSPGKMTKEEEDALISSILEKEGLEAEEAQQKPEDGDKKESEKVDKLPGSVNVTAVAAAVVVVVVAVMGILLYRHKNRFKNK